MKFHEAIQEAYPNLTIVDADTPKQLMESGVIPMITKEVKGVTFIYPQGIYFRCVGCGNCCKQDVPLDRQEVESGLFKLKDSGDALSFTGKFIKGCKGSDCIYLKDKKCTIYGQRPIKCKTYPWMPENRYRDRIVVQLYIELLEGYECNGWHKGKMKFEHLKGFVSAIKREFKVMRNTTTDEVLKNVSKEEFAKKLRRQAETEVPWVDISKLIDDDLIRISRGGK